MSSRRLDIGVGVEAVALAAGGWRLSDPSVPENHAECVVAYVEQTHRGFEVTWVRFEPGLQQCFASLPQVLRAASVHIDAVGAA